VEGALARALASGRTTRDLGGKLGTMEMAREVAGLMA
jgi:isocitrate/isopropylmalate dehydrogenase